mgnify:CR=1 FL=1
MSQEEIEEIKQDYQSCLQDLTSNSMPIIKNLTIIAQENVVAAQAITKVIEEHLRKVCIEFLIPRLNKDHQLANLCV